MAALFEAPPLDGEGFGGLGEELAAMREKIDTFREVLAAGGDGEDDGGGAALLEELFGPCVRDTLERLAELISLHADDDPGLLARLFALFEDASAAAEAFNRRTAGPPAAVPPPHSEEARSEAILAKIAAPAPAPPAAAAEATPPAAEAVAAEPLPDIVCPICMDEVKGSDCIRLQCGHQFCLDCLDDWLGVRVKDGHVRDVKCPDPRCTQELSYAECTRIITDDATLQKYEQFLFLEALRAEPNLRWCPKPGCGNAMIGDPQYPRMRCSACGHEFCFRCNEDWHEGTCEQYQQWKLENGKADVRMAEWAREHTKKCPKCGAMIEKNSGCNHMTCANCHYQFCWLCGGKYTESHFAPWNVSGCPGLMFTHDDDKPAQGIGQSALSLARRVGMRCLVGAGLVVGGAVVAALAVPTLLIGGPIYGGYRIHKHNKRKERERRRRRFYQAGCKR